MPEIKEQTMFTCEPFGSRCNICGGFFPEGDDICVNGHQIGEHYSVPASPK